MIADAESLDDGQVLRAEVCIVGSGAAGTTLALSLIERGIDVLVLESGGLEVDPEIEKLNRGTMSGLETWSLDSHRRRVLGGSTIRWAGWCMPFYPFDFERRSHIPHSGWPITVEDLRPFYEAAHRRVELADPQWDSSGASRKRAAGPWSTCQEGGARFRTLQISPPTRFGIKYRPTLEKAPEASVYLHATVVEIRLDARRERVTRLRCATHGGKQFEVEVGTCILAMGGIENARLLLASNDQISVGVANSSDAVGRYFMEHPHMSAPLRLRAPDIERSSYLFAHRVRLSSRGGTIRTAVQGMLALKPEVLESEGLLDMTVAVESQEGEPGLTGQLEGSDVEKLFFHDGEVRDYRLYMRCEQSPHPESRITLKTQKDALGMPRADLRWMIDPQDWVKYTRSAEILGAELAAAGLGRLWIQRDNGLLAHRPAPGGHHMGSTRMSADPREGVVDKNCRAHDVENLYIAGSSVFTTGAAANPTLTIVTLAERLAAHLAEEVL